MNSIELEDVVDSLVGFVPVPGTAPDGNQVDVADRNRDSKPLAAGMAKDCQEPDGVRGVSGSP